MRGIKNLRLKRSTRLKYLFILIFGLCFFSTNYIYSQDTDGDSILDSVDIDDDNDGILDINEGFICSTFDGSLWINDEDRQIIQVSNINGTPTQANIVTLNTTEIVGDIGFAPDGTLYAVIFNSLDLFRVDLSTGALTSVATVPFPEASPDFNALSFDQNGFAYVGASDSTRIYRVNPNTGVSTLWVDFGPGSTSAGDFIFLNGFVYAAWRPTDSSNNIRLYEITINSNNDFVSFRDMGALPANTFALSSDSNNTLFAGVGDGSIYSFIPPTNPVTTISITLEYDLSGGDQVFGLTSEAESIGNGCFTTDTDADGIPNHIDLDADGDGILDIVESQTTASTITPSGIDSDNDGLDDAFDATPTTGPTGSNGTTPINSDTDSVADVLDIDADDDGIPDNVEAQATLGYITPSGSVGTNGVDSAYENNDTFSATTFILINTDGDTEPDYRDLDSDADGINDIAENGDSDTITSGIDTDGDGLDDNFEGSNINDADVNDEINTPSTDLPDTDSDVNTGGDVDFRDVVTGLDSDGDGIPDIVDIDDDGDGILDINDCQDITIAAGAIPTNTSAAITFNSDVDRQERILTNNNDGAEFNTTGASGSILVVAFGQSLPVGTTVIIEADRDNGTDFATFRIQQTNTANGSDASNPLIISNLTTSFVSYNYTISGTSATHLRISLDAIESGGEAEIDHVRWNSITNCVDFDTDGDGILNSLDLDSDNDGITDNLEAQTTAGFTAPTGTDTDNDGLDDAYDATPTTGITGSNGIIPVNTDGTFGADYLDIDSDNDGIPDNVEAQSTLGYAAPTGNVGTNGLDSAYENVDTFTPVTIPITNTDGDAEPDYRDTDSDGDGTTDLNENGEGNILSGSDLDGDGLDNNFDQDNVTYDVNDNINTPSTDLPDADSDVNSGGDVDYRDGVTGLDTDGDRIPDLTDIDDDGDGILDINECQNIAIAAGAIPTNVGSAITFNSDVDRQERILTNNNDGAEFNTTGPSGSILVVAFGQSLPVGTTVIIEADRDNGTDFATFRIQQANTANGSDASNPLIISSLTTSFVNYNYTISGTSATHLRISLDAIESGGEAEIDHVRWNSTTGCVDFDTDGDGIVDRLDLDSDNDGITDNLEGQTTVGFTAPTGTDTDNDGLDDAYDTTPSGGASGSIGVNPTNSDTDDNPDYLDIDADNDGIPDNVEAQTTLGYIAPNGVSGNNGLDNAYDFTDLYISTGLNTSLVNTDGDSEPDFRDTDSDADGTNDIAENGDTDNVISGTDTDDDGLDDAFEGASTNDVDVNDEINTPSTDLPDGDSDVNSGGDVDYRDDLVGTDTDGDGIINAIDIDDDNDGILDTVEGDAVDFDGDGIVNSLDLDSDGDGILDITESQLSGNSAISLSGNDTDMDGLDDAFDDTVSSGPTGSNGTESPLNSDTDGNLDYLDIDSDNDGIPDNVELQTTQGYTAPTGNVGLNGVDEVYENNDTFTPTGLTPNDFSGTDQPDYRSTNSDSDAFLDADESGITLNPGSLGTDSDGDGLDDIYEGSDATAGEAYDVNDEINDPINDLLDTDNDASGTGDLDYRDSISGLDTDGDGIVNFLDIDDDNDGILDTIEDAVADIDADGIPNSLDIDSDNDGIPDNIEAQSTLGYIAPSGSGAGITDVDMDGLDDVYDPNCTPCVTNGTAITPVNTDNITGNNTDTTPDYLDADSDGDGLNDILENGNANTVSGIDTDGDGLDDAFEGVVTDNDVNDNINNPLTDLPDIDTDASTPGSNTPAADYNDVDYRDIDDDRVPITAGRILWVRSDRGASGSTTLTGWTDQTNTGIVNTINGNPTINQFINFNPTVTFDGNGDYITTNLSINSNTYPDISVFAVYTPAVNSAGGVWGEDDGAWDRFILDGNTTTLNNLVANGSGPILNIPNIFPVGNTVVTTVTFDEDTANGAFVYANGLQSANFTPNHGPETSNVLQIGAIGKDDFHFNGSISEIIVFGSVLTPIHRQSVESYLATKSGVTLESTNNNGTIVEGDYLLNDQTTKVWDFTANSAYHNDVAGIVRDDDILLYQKQSRSINSDAIITIGLGDIVANNASNINSINTNKSALMWGNNNANLATITSSALLCETENQMNRIWKIVETGTVGTVEIAAVKATVDNALNETSVILLKVADDANFTTNVKHIPVATRTVNGTVSYVADFDFNGTKYFTYSDILGIFWNGDANAWTGGAGTSNAPTIDPSADGTKILVIDAETSGRNAIMTASANVECVWVKPNSKLVINNDLFLEFNQDFLLEGEIRLIGDAQLVQSHTGLTNVEGNGVIYRDQASRLPNTFRYNYWSSPVVAARGNTSYTVESVMKDGTTPTSENSTIKEINFVDYTGALNTLNGAPTDPITIASFWIYSYFNGVDRDDWIQQIHTGDINIGEGYIMKSTGRAPQNFTFTGSPNDGIIAKNLTSGTFSLLGNPYPSVINANQFITDNQDVIDGTLYFWEHLGESTTTDVQTEGHGQFGYIGGYSQRNRAMGVAANSVVNGTAGLGQETYRSPPQFIAVGQGFFVSAPANQGGTLLFQNSQRGFDTSNIFFRNSSDADEDLPNFKLGMDYVNNTNAEVHRQIGINFKEGNTFDYESGYDSKTFDMQPTDMFWDFEEIESNLIIAGVGEINADLQIPLGFDIDSDFPVTVLLDEKENMEGYTIYLGDLITGKLYNLENPVELNLPKGNYSNRFVILFGGSSLSADDNPLLQGLNVYRNNDSQEIIIRNNNNTEIKKVELFNILGQAIKTWKSFDSTTEQRLKASAPSAIYIVKVSTDKGEITKKVVFD